MNTRLEQTVRGHVTAVEGFFRDAAQAIEVVAELCAKALNADRKLLFCGNGGSACDAMHIAGEFVGRFVDDRRSLAAIALSADTGIITAVANDYAYDRIFSRQVEGLGQAGDVLISLSTSGKSPNVIAAIKAAKAKGIATVLFTGEKARGLPEIADVTLIVPSMITAHVQESHMVALHAITALIEEKIIL